MLWSTREPLSVQLPRMTWTQWNKAPNNILEIDDPPYFQIQVANGQLEKPLSTATLKFEIGDITFAEHFVVMKKLTGPIFGLHFMRHNSVVIDTTHGLTHFPHLTMQVKTASTETTIKTTASHHWRRPEHTTNDNENKHSFRWPFVKMEHNGDCNIVGEVYVNSKFANFSLNIDNNWQKNNSQSNQYNGITISYQRAHADRRVLSSHSGAIQAHQICRYGNPSYDSTRWPWLDCSPTWTSQNQKTGAARQHVLVPNTWKS